MTKALIEKLKEYRSRYHNEVAVAEVIVDACIDIVKEHSDWVSVSCELPPEDTIVLAFTHFNEIVLAFIAYEDGKKIWIRDSPPDEWTTEQITYWQPLPQPPSEVKNELQRHE